MISLSLGIHSGKAQCSHVGGGSAGDCTELGVCSPPIKTCVAITCGKLIGHYQGQEFEYWCSDYGSCNVIMECNWFACSFASQCGDCPSGSACGNGGGGGGGGGGSDCPECADDSDCYYHSENCSTFCSMSGYCSDDWYTAPLILDLDGNGFDLTNPSEGVLFDMRGSSSPIKFSWTPAASNYAFLALDRNGNGRIDNGKELFSHLTPQVRVKGTELNGFRALALLDQPELGGNGDGYITNADSAYAKLILWSDRNHNGISEPDEMHLLQDYGIKSIAVTGLSHGVMDRRGLSLRYVGDVGFNSGEHRNLSAIMLPVARP